MSSNNTTELFSCQDTGLWNDYIFSGSAPKFPDCFQNTVLVWVPFGFLLLVLPFYFASICQRRNIFHLPLTCRSVLKTFLCLSLAVLVVMSVWAQDTYGYHCYSKAEVPPEYYTAAIVQILVFVFLAFLTQLLRRKHVMSSGLLIFFWILLLCSTAVPVQSAISYRATCVSSIITYVYFAVVFVQCVLYSFADVPTEPSYQLLGQKQQCPIERSSALNQWVLWWFNSVVLTAYKRTIGQDDLWEQLSSLKSDTCVPELEENWRNEIENCENKRKRQHPNHPKVKTFYNNSYESESTPLVSNTKRYDGSNFEDNIEDVGKGAREKPSLLKTIIRTYWRTWVYSSFMKIMCDVFSLLQPVLLQFFIAYLDNKKSGKDPYWNGWTLAILFFLVGELESLFFCQAAYSMQRLGLKVKVALVGLIYQKSLTMSNAAKRDYTVGDIVNLMSVDCQRIQDAFMFQYEIISFFFVVVVALYLIWNQLGVATLGCIGVILVIAILNAFFGKLQQKYQATILSLKSSRIKLLNEVLSGIKVLKMYAWEPSFTKKLVSIRQKEMKFLRKVCVVTAFSVLCSVHSPFMMNYFTLLIYTIASSSNVLNASKVFLALSIVNVLRFPLTMTPFVITGVIQMYVSVNRIGQFLDKEDINPDNVSTSMATGYAVSIDNGHFTWDREIPKNTLNRINLKVESGKLVAVVGQVGSGKSSLISAILGELERVKGTVNVKGTVAYVPQEAWIQNLTVRDNILFGSKYSEKKYLKVIKACALLPDLAILTAGDQTEIGERGINVSGGQKQRISLARSVYSNSDVYLLDDPLSAVDTHVGKDLFQNVIGPEGLLRHKTRILVTHGVHWLPKVDQIIVMDNGTISEIGSYEDLMQHRGAFAQFLETYLLLEDEENEEDDEISNIKNQMWERLEVVSDQGGISAEESDLSRRQSARQSIQKLSRQISQPFNDMKRRFSQLNTVPEVEILSPLQSAKSQSMKRMSSSANVGQLHRSLSQGRILPYDTNEREENGDDGKLIGKEKSEEGSIKLSVMTTYIKAMGIIGTLIAMGCLTLFQGLNVYGNFWLTFWTEDPIIKNTSIIGTQEYEKKQLYYLLIYTVIGIFQGIFLILFAYMGLTRLIKASGYLHASMLRCILRSPMSFFDTTPVGRIMNRFSSDIDILDDRLPRTFRLWSVMIFTLLGIIVVLAINTPVFLVAIIPVGILYNILMRYYLPTARQLKRIEGITRSPVYNHFSESISGASCIRAYRAVDRFIDESQRRVDKNATFFFAAIAGTWWIGVRLELLGNILVLAAALFSVLSDDLNGADIGLSLTYAMQIIIALNLVVQAVSEMEMNIVSAERAEEYTRLEAEAQWIEQNHRPPDDWPNTGEINFESYTLRYRKGLDLVLKGIDCSIKGAEKIGIVGRTGAGKSSITLALFRIIEAAGGRIVIDKSEISKMGLHDLRSKITILPQDPVIFSGTLRMNLDPLKKFTDRELWQAIERAHLKDFVTSSVGQLHMKCVEAGQNLSVGQRQLVCLARTLLHKTKILILDEATAAVDVETDDLIQSTIKTEFEECTVLSIAHRLNTIIDYDRIMVLDKGLIVEFDTPENLLKNRAGTFYSMAKDANLVS